MTIIVPMIVTIKKEGKVKRIKLILNNSKTKKKKESLISFFIIIYIDRSLNQD